jgi:hypothetical protein
MKKLFGSVYGWLFVLSSLVSAAPLLNTDNGCTDAMGFIPALYNRVYVIVSPLPDGSGGVQPPCYYSRGWFSTTTGIFTPSHTIVYNTASGWTGAGWSFHDIPQCALDFVDAVVALSPSARLDFDEYFDDYFTPPLPESRLPLDDDLDGDGRPDYYDLDCSHYDDYLEFCREQGIDPGGLPDYMYYYQYDLGDYLMLRLNTGDSDGDGFSDGYEIIHGSEHLDPESYPIGRPDVGTTTQIMGGVAGHEAWRYEQYQDSGFSRGHVYDRGYDPYGTTPISVVNADFHGPPDWYSMDSSGDGLSNAEKIQRGQNPYQFNFQSGYVYSFDENGGYWVFAGGITDGDFPDWTRPPTEEEWMQNYDKYHTGEYEYHPSDFSFNKQDYDAMLDKFDKIKLNIDSFRPDSERDYKVIFSIPMPGGHGEQVSIAAMPDPAMPGGAALNSLRLIIRGMSAVVISYVFIRHVWLVIRQY